MTRERRPVVGFFLLIDAAALGWAIGALASLDTTRRDWAVLGLLGMLALVYEVGARRTGRLQFRWSAGLRRDMTPIWSVAAAAALPPGLAVLLLVAVFGYLSLRVRRPARKPAYRSAAAACTVLLACLSANAVVRASAGAWDDTRWMLGDALAIGTVIIVHAAVHRGLVTAGLALAGRRGKLLLGTQDDNLHELATLCLGGLVALAALRAPWLAVLVLPSMVSLQRGAFVRELETAATVDAKTGLLNALAWEDLTRRELARGRRNQHPVGILLLDVDRFKLVNDRFGHLVGDDVLRRIGVCLKGSVREFDTVGRFGGEEFVVVLPEASAMESVVVAERLRARIHELRVSAIAGGIQGAEDEPISVSIGVACAPDDGTDLADVLLAADGALYAAKARGRNCVVLTERDSDELAEPLVGGA